MRRWDATAGAEVEDPRVDAFITDIVIVCNKHGMALRHEDEHGAFVVRFGLRDEDIEWLRAAMVERTKP